MLTDHNVLSHARNTAPMQTQYGSMGALAAQRLLEEQRIAREEDWGWYTDDQVAGGLAMGAEWARRAQIWREQNRTTSSP